MLETTERELRTAMNRALVEYGICREEPNGTITMYLSEDSFDGMIDMVIEEVKEL